METSNIPLSMEGKIMKCLSIKPSYIAEMMELFPEMTNKADLRYDMESILIAKSELGQVHWEETSVGILWHKTVFAGAGAFSYDPARHGGASSPTADAIANAPKSSARLAEWRAKRVAKQSEPVKTPAVDAEAAGFYDENPFESSLAHSEWLAALDSAATDFEAKRSAKVKKGAQ